MDRDRQSETRRSSIRVDARRSSIADEVAGGRKVYVSDLAKEFQVSEVTVRADLDALERMGKLRRVRGGAIVSDRMNAVADISRRMGINTKRKRLIAQMANGLVADGDSIIIDSGSTAFEFEKTLTNKRGITIITHDLNVATYADNELPDASVILLGGSLRTRHGYCWGSLSLSMLDQLYVDMAFLGANGYASDQGFMTENPNVGEMKRASIMHSRRTAILLDSSKVGIHSFLRFADLRDVDFVVMDEDPDRQVADAAARIDMGPEIILSKMA